MNYDTIMWLNKEIEADLHNFSTLIKDLRYRLTEKLITKDEFNNLYDKYHNMFYKYNSDRRNYFREVEYAKYNG